ncbi:hypothetical protein MYX07_03070 [Patescibacteria group bacterium AH-259-L07]|nr:hypothetical protein [Patescibacteria group bacterium AH-259-L07]
MTNQNSKSVKCQNCKQHFTIEPEDFDFYEKIKVPAPTFCPDCRLQRRLMFRNERSLYKRRCELCGKDTISIHSPDKPLKVFCSPCWWSDKWDPLEYGREYDPSRSFFEQFKELEMAVPYPNLIVDHPTNVRSDYVNHAGQVKDCYLVFDSDNCENTHYAATLVDVKDSMDCNVMWESQLCYWDINCMRCYNTFFSEDCTDCHDIYFSKHLSGCSNCFGCINLRNKSYHIFNRPYKKEEYERKFKDFTLDTHSSVEALKAKVHTFWGRHPHRYMLGWHNVNVSGDYVYESKQTHYSYQTRGVENGKYCCRIGMKPARDVYDYFEWGNGAQRIYEGITVGERVDNVRFSFFVLRNCLNIEYSVYIISSSNLFGCVGIRNKEYCILNKPYSKGDYKKLREKIIHDMNEYPYVDSKGRTYKYGEFFPYELSLFDYNESTAMQYQPLTREEVLESGWRWREREPSKHTITMRPDEMPNSIGKVSDKIVEEVLECSECQRAFRVIKPELELLRRFGFTLPRNCPDCRHMERFNRITPPRLWHRKCHCGGTRSEDGSYQNTTEHFHKNNHCPNEFKTSYSPERKEIVYCEKCYQSEVV